MDLTPQAEDALFALFAVKRGFVSEAAVEKALARQAKAKPDAERKSVQRLLVEGGALTFEQAKTIREELDPEVIEGFRIEAEAGRGGMGVVYRATQLSMDRTVAVKVLSRRLSSDEVFVEKFVSEARSAAKLNHEHIVAAIDVGVSNDLHYFVMEFVDGRSVADELEAGQVYDHQRAFEVAEQVARALTHAHAAGLVHRDVKPENIMIAADGRAKLCDLGLARPSQEAGTGEKSATTEGTPYYCSPEQALGRTDIDRRSDIYSLGATLFHMLAGEPPYDGESARAIMVRQVREPFPDLDARLPNVPPPFRRLLETMVVKDREQRLESARAFEEGLAQARRESAAPPPAASGRAPGSLATFGLVAAVFLLFALVGAAISSALVGDATGGGGVAGGGGSAPAKPPGPTPDSGPTLTPGPGGEDGLTGPLVNERPADVPGQDPELAAARRLFQQAQAHRAEHPDDPWETLSHYQQLIELYPTSPIAREAEQEIQGLAPALQKSGARALEDLALESLRLLEARQYRAAGEAVDAFEQRWRPRKVPQLEGRLQTLRRSIEQQAAAQLQQVLSRLDQDPGAQDELRALMDQLPQAQAALIRERLEAGARSLAARLLTQARDASAQALLAGDLARAREPLEEARADGRLAPVADELARDLADLSGAARARDVVLEGLAALGRRPQASLRLASGETLTGRVVGVDAQAWSVRLEVAGEQRALRLAELDPAELLPLALPAEEGRFNALAFLCAGALDAAQAALDAQARATGSADPALRERIDRARGGLLERRAEDLIARLLDPALAAPEAVEALRAFPAELRGTAAYRARHAELLEAYRRARAVELLADPRSLFRGELTEDKKGRVSLKYTFADPQQVEDFVLDKQVDPDSRCALQPGQGMVVSGKASHVARFSGGDVEVDLRAVPRSAEGPNINIVLSDGPGWRGQLLGVGFRYGTMTQIKVDAAAEKRGGYVVDLPACVFINLEGQRPQPRMRQVLSAEDGPPLKPDRAVRINAKRDARGKVRLKVGSRIVCKLDEPAGWDAPGGVALAPFGAEVLVEELELSGTLDPAWAGERAAELAGREAAACLPAPGS